MDINKRAIYETIMNAVSIEVKNAIDSGSIYEMAKKINKPSGWSRKNTKKRKVSNQYLVGDVFDRTSGTYRQEDEYSDSNYEGFIYDKEGNEYKVYGYATQGDAGRIAGGSTNYRVVISGDDLKITLTGYTAIFSNGSGTSIIPDIEAGYYLEDYLAINRYSIASSKTDKIEELIAAGDANAKSYSANKKEKQENKDLAFAQRYVEFRFANYTCSTSSSKLQINIGRLTNGGDKEQMAKLEEIIAPFIEKLLEGSFKLSIDKLYGLKVGIAWDKEMTDKYDIKPAIDVKKRNLVYIKTDTKIKNGEVKYIKSILDTPVTLRLPKTIQCKYKDASPELQKILDEVSKHFKAKNKKSRASWIKDKSDSYYSEYTNAYWGTRKYTRAQANDLAKSAWESFMSEYDTEFMKNRNEWLSIDVETLSEYISKVNADYTVKAKTPDTAINDLPETTLEEKQRGKSTELSKAAWNAAYDKMKAWHEGTRKQNIGAMSDAKLKHNYNVCKELGFDKEMEILKDEADKRNIVLESVNYDKLTKRDLLKIYRKNN